MENTNINLPIALNRYNNADFASKLKVRFIFYVNIFLAARAFLVLISTIYIEFNSKLSVGHFFPEIYAEIGIVLLFLTCLIILVRGYLNIAANLLLIIAFASVWFVMIIDKGDLLTRLDTVVLILAILTTTPVFITRHKYIILVYLLVNLFFLFGFMLLFRQNFLIPDSTIIEFLVDTSVALIFIGVVAFNNFRINKISIEKVLGDVKELEIAEKALAESEKKYREMTELLPQTIFESDFQGNITYVNKSGFLLYGYTQDDFQKGINIFNLIIPEERLRAIENMNKLYQGIKIPQNQYMSLKKDGSSFFVQVYTSIIEEDQKPIGLRGIIVDITEQKLAEKALEQSEELFKTLIELLPYAVLVTDYGQKHLIVNSAYCKELDCKKEEIIGRTVEDVGYKLDAKVLSSITERIQKMGFVENVEMKVTNKNRVESYVYFSSKMINMNNQPVILSSTINITEKKKIEEELIKHRKNLELLVAERTEELGAANEALMTSNHELLLQREELQSTLDDLNQTQKQLIESEKMASLGILSAGIAHEINNPLNFIKGGIGGIESYLTDKENDKTEDITPLLNAVNLGVERVEKIVASLSHFSRQTESITEKCNIHEVIDNCLVMMQNQIKHLAVIEKHYTDKQFDLIGNDGKLHQAFLNIISNSLHALKNKGIISIFTEVRAQKLLITISDNGHGIDQEHLSKIFDPFFTTKEPGKGTGLGLSITYKIIQEHKGQIHFESEVGKGTTVVISLPVQ